MEAFLTAAPGARPPPPPESTALILYKDPSEFVEEHVHRAALEKQRAERRRRMAGAADEDAMREGDAMESDSAAPQGGRPRGNRSGCGPRNGLEWSVGAGGGEGTMEVEG
eukprot:CAMPEP_0180318650 /NCGR_PEP_ID=MMETSP0988-20121125/34548_1 /TAXON_ID=697907 /ORGANISM="non described non described, Strain CCMP2293" /LENGTH=109 /DNA_ID=CAMNT_0022304115 /DNA_START=51 /DNA_END=380 /DNA_ORIENTATION=+